MTDMAPVLDASAAAELLGDASRGSTEILGVLIGEPVLIVELGRRGLPEPLPRWLPWVVVGIAPPDLETGVGAPATAGCDVVLAGGPADTLPAPFVGVTDPAAAAEALAGRIGTHPQASIILAQVLRAAPGTDLATGLWNESLAYSTLQRGPELTAWLAGRDRHLVRAQPGEPVLVERDGPALWITLNRPHVRNAVDVAVRDQLCAALATATADPRVNEVHLGGNGPDFCSGGDLDEFGTTPDPATGHLVRTVRGMARALASVGKPTRAHLHGWCIGAGIEVAALADQIEASDDTTIRLPELEMGLIPGAGGTATIPRRIGRQRTAWLALSGEAIGAATAHAWGLIDRLTTR